MTHELDVWALTAVISLLILVWALMDRRRSKSRVQFRLYASAADALKEHYDAMERFVSDPAAPRIAVETLLAINEISADRRDAAAFAASLCKMPPSKRSGDGGFRSEMERLHATRPDLEDEFYLALGAGMVALFLRWPETAGMLPKFVAKLNSLRDKQDAGIAAERFWSENKKNRSHGLIHGLPAGA